MARPRIVAVDHVFDSRTQGVLDITSKGHPEPAHDRDGRSVGTISAGEHAVNVRGAKGLGDGRPSHPGRKALPPTGAIEEIEKLSGPRELVRLDLDAAAIWGRRSFKHPKSDADAISVDDALLDPSEDQLPGRRLPVEQVAIHRRLACDRVEAVKITRGSPSQPPVEPATTSDGDLVHGTVWRR